MTPRSDEKGKARWVGRAPGRIDFMGGAGCYTGSLVLGATTAEATWASVELRDDRRIVIVNPQACEFGWETRGEFSLEDVTSDESVRQLVNAGLGVRWTASILGAIYLLKEWFPDRVTRGVNIYIKSEAPVGKGAGSSAALEVAAMKTAAFAYGIELAGVELAAARQWVENMVVESACGIADAVAVTLGEEGQLLPILCQPCQPQSPLVLADDLRWWGIDSGVGAADGAEQDAVRAATFMAYKPICDWEGSPAGPDEGSRIARWTDRRWNGYLSNVPPSVFRSNYEPRLPETMTGAEYLQSGQAHADPFTQIAAETVYRVRACARYAVEENQRVRLFVELARAGSGIELMGELMYQSHYAYTECGLGSEETDQIVSLVCEEGASNGLYGAKITGRGCGGTVVVLGRKDAEGSLRRVVERFAGLQGRTPYIFDGSSMGADRFGVLAV